VKNILPIKEVMKIEINGGEKRSWIKTFWLIYSSPEKKAVLYYRIAKKMYEQNFPIIPLLIKNRLINLYGLHISLKAEVGIGLEFRHINGVIIGDGVKIGKNVVIYQQVTLGGRNLGDGKRGSYPTIGDNVTLFAGAKVLGEINIGNNSIVGANSVVTKNIPSNTIAAGVPAKKIKEIHN